MMQKRVLRSLVVGLLVVMGLSLGVWAQSVSLTVTVYSDAVRFSAQGAVKELRVEVLSLSGQKVFDSGPVLSNALDWKLLNTQGQPVANGVYLYTVTIKDPFGNVTKKLGKIAILRGKGVAAPPLSGITVGGLATGNPRLQVQWDVTGDYTIQGKLGVGTETPAAPIHILTPTFQTMIRMIDDRQTITGTTPNNTWGAGKLRVTVLTPSCTNTGAIFRIERATGNACADGSWNAGGADVAEYIFASEPLEPGDVVELDPSNPKHYRKARTPYSSLIAGVISTRPGVVLGARKQSEEQALVALLGRVPVKASAENGPIRPGDLLTSASKPGYAMRCESPHKCEGALLGKALEALDAGEGVILMLVMR